MTDIDLLVIGGSGFVGSRLVDSARNAGLKVAYTYSRNPLALPAPSFRVRIQEYQELEACIEETRPRCIVYCAVPSGNDDESLHEVISVQGIQRVCSALKNYASCKLVYVSTNAVFSGQAGPYQESDLPDPDKRQDQYRVYSMMRAQGEQVALNSWHHTIVARTSDVNGRDLSGNLNRRLANLLAQLESGCTAERSTKAIISPTLVDNLAEGLLEISNPDFSYRGILHLAGSQQVSYYDFACRIAEKIKADKALIKPEYRQVRNISLDTHFTQDQLRTRLLNVEEQLSLLFPSIL